MPARGWCRQRGAGRRRAVGRLRRRAVFERGVRGADARSEHAIIEIEARDGKLAPRGGPPELLLLARGMDAQLAAETAALRGAHSLYVIDLSTDGRLGGPPLVLLEQLRRAAGKGVSFHTGGGVRDLNDIRALAEWGAASVVVGRAFLEGVFTVAEAKAACA